MRAVVNGVFDMLHVGHLRLLQRAKQDFGWVLAAVDSDAFCINEKREPVVPQLQRLEMLAALRCVDEVCLVDGGWGPYSNSSDIVDAFVSKYQIDVLVCGADDDAYVNRWFSYLNRLNKVVCVPRTVGVSTTELISIASQRVRT